MKHDHRALSLVRQESPFATPPHILVVADVGDVGEAVELAEALDEYGADAEVRLADDDYTGDADAVIFAGAVGGSGVFRRGAVKVALCDDREPAEGYDLVLPRAVKPRRC
jgi:hypothetical protein